jgi:tetratricopeptide (TPR) repeat protein
LAKEDRVALMLTELRVNQAQGHRDHVGALLQQLTALAPANSEVLLEMGRYHDGQAREEPDEAARALVLAEAKTHYQLAAANEATAYAASLALGQMLVRERRFVEAMPHLEKALQAKKSDSLDQYVSRVRRAAERQKAKQERESEERREKATRPGIVPAPHSETTTPKKQ